MAYSAVTHPNPDPARHRGTPSVALAAHSTRVSPNSISTEPAGCFWNPLVIRTGRTSLDIAVDVYAGDPKRPDRRRTGHCVMVFVALGADGRPAAVPTWRPETDLDRALEGFAERLSTLRKQMDAEMDARLGTLRGDAGIVPA